MKVGSFADEVLVVLVSVYIVCIANPNHVLAYFMEEKGCPFIAGFGLVIDSTCSFNSRHVGKISRLDFYVAGTLFVQVGYYSSWCSKANAVGGKKLQSLRHDQVGIKVKKPNLQGKIKANMDMKHGMRIRVMMEDLGF